MKLQGVALSLILAGTSSFAATRLPFSSGFETGNFSEWDGGLDETLVVTSDDSYSGQYSARSTMIAGQATDNYKDFYFGDHEIVGGDPVDGDGLWLRFYVKFDVGFNYGGAPLHKIALINFTDSNGRRRYQLLINVLTETGEYMVEHLRWNADGSFGASLPGIIQDIGEPATVRYGQWDKIKLFALPNTPGQSNGIVRLWINDVLKADYTNVAMREDTQFNPNKLILSNYVTHTANEGQQWWDDFYLGEEDPDATPRPLPPTNLQAN